MRRAPALLPAVLLALGFALAAAPAAGAQPGGPVAQELEPPEAVIVRYAAGTSAGERAEARRDADVRRAGGLALPLGEVVEPGPGTTVREAVRALERAPGVRYAEPDRPRRAFRTPDDALFGFQWALRNTGQAVGGRTGTPGADIRATEAWDVTTGGEVLVAVVDTGTDLTHPDLVPNLWANPGESGGGRDVNGTDDDGNGVIDDVRGADFVQDGSQPYDANGHGTHVAGTIAAAAGDGRGVAGVAWQADVATVRVLDGEGSGTASDLIAGYRYAQRIGARVVNASLGGDAPSRAEREAIAAASDVLFVVAAGNDGADNDVTGSYPCNYGLPNVVCVAATDQDDRLAAFSNFGATRVDLAAPGVSIASTWPRGRHVLLDGTSMAAPHVAGAAVLALARNPSLTPAELREALLATAEPLPSLAGRVVSGARLDLAALVAAIEPAGRDVPAPEQTGPDPAPQQTAPEQTAPEQTAPSQPSPSPSPAPAAAQPQPEPTQPAPAPDTRAPGLGVMAARRVRLATLVRGGITVRARCSEACTVRFVLRAPGGRTVRATARRTSSGSLTRRLRSPVRTRAGRAVLTVTATDAAGNRRTRSRRVTVVR